MNLSIGLSLTRPSGPLGFNPASLFASGEVGAWYDPSDSSTVWQDAAGTTPATVGDPVGRIDDKSGNGNHATQSTSAARPVLSARHNLLTYSEQFDSVAWTKQNATVTANTETAPDGTGTADTLTASASTGEHRVYTASPPPPGSYNRSVYAKAGTASFISMANGVGSIGYAVYDLSLGEIATTSGSVTANMTSVGNGWYRCEIVGQSSGNGFLVVNMGATAANAVPQASWTAVGTETVYLWGAQIENPGLSSVRPYQRIAAATDYVTTSTMGGYVFQHYLDFDGVDDWLSVATLPAATQNTLGIARYFAPAMASSGFFYFMDTTVTGIGLFHYTTPRYGFNTWNNDLWGEDAEHRGATEVDVAYFVNGNPTTSGVTLRVNGSAISLSQVQPTSVSRNMSGGAKIGTGAVTGLFHSDVNVYGIVVVNRTLTAGEITDLETYLAAKSGVTL